MVALCLVSKCRGGVCKERSCVLPVVVAPKSSVEVPCVGALCGQVSGFEILLGEGGDVELGARTSKHILLFAFDPLTLNSLSLLLCLASFHIDHSHLYAWLVCVCITCWLH